ncbi:hypothetical protein [Methyloferula stellata]|uniref:hypothetical protein n=1 Tax=Methyloferula stellata TaxID=876270 RepID=UPI0003687620|nr:hypothetical protein [Methyloferula stellata]
MRLRVLDDLRPGYAQLAFDGPLTQPTLHLSVRSQQEGGFLGPDGSWQKSAHYFTASRIEGDDRSTVYRVGPEIVNHLRELDTVEFANDDGSLRFETTWENAVPQMPKIPGGRPGHSIYGVQSQPLESPQAIATPEPTSGGDAVPEQQSQDYYEAEQEAEPGLQTSTPPPLDEEATTLETRADTQRSRQDRDDGTGGGSGRRGFLLPLLLGLIVLAGAGFTAYKFVPCDWLPQGYCPVDKNEVEALQKARVCAFYKSQGGLDCDVAKDCVEPYITAYPKGPSRPELEAKAKTSNDVCKQMVDAAQTAFTCIDDLKKRGRSRCDVQVACTRTFQSLYSIGPMRRKIDDAAQQAQVDCECESKPLSCENGSQSEPKQPEVNPKDAEEDKAWQESNQCAHDNARKCASPGCYADYLNTFASGLHRSEAQTDAETIAKSCSNADEQAALQAARECARGPRRCTAHCYSSYLSKYRTSDQNGSDAQSESAQIDNECKSAHDEDDAWLAAKRCAAAATACNVEACYRGSYLTRYGASGSHRADADVEISRAKIACQKLSQQQTVVAEGKYWGRSLAACGAKTDFGINVEVKGNRINWEHDFLGVKYQWDGTIDPSGNVLAKVQNTPGATATGVISEAEKIIQMKYPQCTSGPVQLEIRGKME